ncbi:MAG: hypothetical protein J6K84_01325 [Oscillospiraceae bacterium]|nr:hypothetical protein [Oscillospiraceae bacterium]
MYRGKHVAPSNGGKIGKVIAWTLVSLLLLALVGGGIYYFVFMKQTETPSPLPVDPAPVDPQPVDPQPGPAELERKEKREALLKECEALSLGYFYDEAIEKLESCADLQNEETDALLEEIRGKKDALVPYESTQYYHIFFHSLIMDTAKAFDGDYDSKGYDLYMTTVDEFSAMLPLLYEGGFVLYDLKDMMEVVDGQVQKKTIYLPEGKKPLVISVDDVNYYDYMQGDGFAERLDVDENGNVVTIVDGNPTYDGDVVPLLDAFVKEHPDFSYRGAKGTLAITGYEGAFGYRITDLHLYDEETQKWMLDKTMEVSDALRATGWNIACHSYTHNQYWTERTITMNQIQYDIGRWKRDVVPYVGETNIFIAPFGVYYGPGDARFDFLLSEGFNIYCTVEASMNTRVLGNCFFQGRMNLDGWTMKDYPERIEKHFFDPMDVLDENRPGVVKPAEPIEPDVPAEPIEPAVPDEPIEPIEPAEPTEPTTEP